jgi:hypothetical protein
MRAARMYGYNEPLRLVEIPVPDIGPDDGDIVGRAVIAFD